MDEETPEINDMQLRKIISTYRSRNKTEDLDYIQKLKGVQYILRALNTSENKGISKTSLQQRKSIFGDNSKKIENEKLNVNFSVDFWILNLYAIL